MSASLISGLVPVVPEFESGCGGSLDQVQAGQKVEPSVMKHMSEIRGSAAGEMTTQVWEGARPKVLMRRCVGPESGSPLRSRRYGQPTRNSSHRHCEATFAGQPEGPQQESGSCRKELCESA